MEETLFHVMTIARQIDGEYVFIKSEKAFKNSNKANDLLQKLKTQYTQNGQVVPVNLMTPHGEIPCYCEIGVFEVKIEKQEENG